MIYVSERGKLCHTYSMFMIQILCIRKTETVLYLQYIYYLDFVNQKVSEREKLYYSHNIFMMQIVCITKREAVSYLQYVDDLDFVYQKGGNCVMPTVCLCSRLCVSERGKLYLTYSMFMLQILCIRKTETVSYLQYVYALDFVCQKEGNCAIPTVCFVCRLCVSESRNLYHSNMIGTFWLRKLKSNCIPIYELQKWRKLFHI